MDEVIYLEDDADQCSDEPKPKADVMTISGADAMALDETANLLYARAARA